MPAKKQSTLVADIKIRILKPVTLDFRTKGVPHVNVPPGEVVTVTLPLAKELVLVGSAEYVGDPPAGEERVGE